MIVINVIIGVSGSFSAAGAAITSCCLLLLHLAGNSTGLFPNPPFRNDSGVNSCAGWLKNELLCFMTAFIYITQGSASVLIYNCL